MSLWLRLVNYIVERRLHDRSDVLGIFWFKLCRTLFCFQIIGASDTHLVACVRFLDGLQTLIGHGLLGEKGIITFLVMHRDLANRTCCGNQWHGARTRDWATSHAVFHPAAWFALYGPRPAEIDVSM